MATTEGVTIEELRIEIERLSRELDLASTEKIQSAQYGLALLEEKSALQQRCNDLEALYENTKHELEITQEVSSNNFYILIYINYLVVFFLDVFIIINNIYNF